MPKEELDSYLYLFTRTVGQYSDICVVDAHGGYVTSTPTFTTPSWTTLVFYVPHGKVQQDFGVFRFKNPPPVHERIAPGGTCTDYVLTKYQGRHAGEKDKPAETYEGIDTVLAAVEEEMTKKQKYMATNPTFRKQVEEGFKTLPTLFDVLTVRNRSLGGDITLSYVLKQLKAKQRYKEVHAFFCRSPM